MLKYFSRFPEQSEKSKFVQIKDAMNFGEIRDENCQNVVLSLEKL